MIHKCEYCGEELGDNISIFTNKEGIHRYCSAQCLCDALSERGTG